jgi:small subunit ribosomal protein S13
MAEEKQDKKPEKKQEVKQDKQKEEKASKRPQEDRMESIVRVYGFDIPGNKNILVGLTYIKGISWALSNAICKKLNLQMSKKIQDMSKDELKKIEDFLEVINVYDFMKNRRFAPDTGKTSHIYASDLDIAKEFDIKRLKTMKSFVGIRHAAGQPVRGQRTKSHFRKKKTAIVGKKAAPKVSKAPTKEKY